MMKVGIVGMPNAGKSSLFNALSQAGAQAANYPFTTIEPNVAVVGVEDERLTDVARIVRSSNIVWDTIEFHDIAGLVAGAHKGEGLGNQFLANIRETDALLHVVRAHQDPNVIHPDGKVDPSADMDTIETELIYADLEQAERRHARIVRDARGGDRALIAEEAWLREAIAALQAGRPVRTVPLPKEAPHAARDLGALTAKPVLYVANVDEGDDDGRRRSWPSTPRRARPARWRSPRGSRPSCRSSTTRRRPRCARSSGSPSRACSASSTARSRCST